ncbi:protein EARLY FLOWERING 3 [Sesamum angolense]|uniref:Protein EARLY FLOWERING 3 n=1 Tax=Sesamum angolense TaxID=2727404 RepID=A0AAE2BKJ1_9LAMI|nr:protein EARLY FLOWERING 3 [Sesamum angolense]
MKRGKDEEKMMGPMFPRLHVNDTEKGGPRAPPRNKMALYEQLSIPSQRFNHPVMPCNPNNSAATLVPRLSKVNDRGMYFSRQVPPGHPLENQYSQFSDISTPLPQLQQKKKLNEDDYSVPVFVHSISSQEFDKYSTDMDRERISSSNPHIFNHSLKSQDAKETGMTEHSTRQEGNNQKRENSKEVVVGWVKAISSSLSIEKQTGPSLIHEPRDEPSENIDRLKTVKRVRPQLCAKSQPSSNRQCNAALRKNTTSVVRRNSSDSNKGLPSEDQNLVHGVSNDTESSEDGSCRSPQMNNLERGDSVSETSVLDTISGLDITPDDVVGMIGQKHFWKARRALVNQQRLFAVQVFELHRLIKVQKLISASPHVLLEDHAYLGKPLKPLPGKKLPLGCAVIAIPNVSKQKGDTEKPSKKEGSAENTVEKVSSAQNGGLPSTCGPFSANSPAPSVNQSWCFNQPQGPHQWLIPVMSPSEGLVYKPYPVPGFMGQACGPPGSNQMMGNILTPAYGLPGPPPQYQLPSFPPVGPHGYLPPPYGMPIMNTAPFSGSSVEQMNPPATLDRFSAGEANFINQQHNLFISPSQKNGAVPDVYNSRWASEEIEMQASTGSSPIERRPRSQVSNNVEGRNMLPLFPTSPAINASKSTPQVTTPECPSRVIKVIPHNALSASESAARIFRSIQEERKQYDSM